MPCVIKRMSEDAERVRELLLVPSSEPDWEPEGEGDTKLSYEDAVELAGFGRFHALLLLVCGWTNASDALETVCVSYLLPTARCDLQLTSAGMGLVTASVFLGMMVGGYLWGYQADQRGRRRVLLVSLTVNGTFGLLSSLASGLWSFLLLRLLSGLGVGGSIPVVFSYFCEFQPCRRRGAMISSLASFWMVGNIVAAGMAWLLIPSSHTHIQSWRLFVVVCSVPSLCCALAFALVMPESPKFLMEAGREAEAVNVFHTMFKLNHGGACSTFLTRGLQTSRGRTGGDAGFCRQALGPIRKIFRKPLTCRSIVLLIIFFCISFGYYGLWMWFPELFKRMEAGGSPCSNISHSVEQNQTCYPPNTAVYREGFMTAAANLPGNIFTVLLMDCVGGKSFLSGSLLLSGACVFLVWMLQSKSQILVVSCVFSAVSVVSWNALDVVSTELYPTHLRSSALGFFSGVGRVAAVCANVAFGQLLDWQCAVPVLLMSLLLSAGGLAALRLPRTSRTDIA